jgi:hypothetical protein
MQSATEIPNSTKAITQNPMSHFAANLSPSGIA